MLQNLRAIKPERLSAIEIAEGALLADIGIVFQLLATYLPIVGGYLALLVPIPFALLILRRNWYAGIMGFCVALFIIGVLTGPGHVITMALEAGAGIFLGITMKYRIHHLLLLLLGVTGSAILLFSLLIIVQLLSGLPFTRTILSLQRNYLSLLAAIGFISPYLGLGSWWQHSAYPLLASFAQLILTYWYIFFFVGIWIILWPVVIIVYLVTNFLVRLLGYDVNPFPGGVLEKLLHWILQLIIRLALNLGLGKHWLTRTLIKEVRRQGMQRHD